MIDSLFSTAPSLDEPLHILSACHQRIYGQLETLDRLLRWLPDHGADADAQKAAAAVMRYFDTAAVNHHRDEEEDLFPCLIQRVAAEGQYRVKSLVRWAQDDHAALARKWIVLRAQLKAIADGESDQLSADDVANFTARYHNHMDREDNELLPYAAQLLTEADLAVFSRNMKARRRVRV